MKSSHDDDAAVPVLQRMVNALEALLKLRDPAHKVSNGKLILENLKKLQDAYHSLDTEAKDIIADHLKEKNPGLFRALEKKGSKITKPFELAGALHDGLPEELKKLIAENPVLRVMQISAIPTYEVPEEDVVMPDTGTMVVNSGKAAGNQLGAVLASAGRQMDPNLYALFATADPDAPESTDPRTAVIQALEILLKTRIHKEKIQKGEPKPKGYDNAYRETLLKQFHVLNNHKQVFKQVLQQPSNQKQLMQFIEKLDKDGVRTIPDMLKLVGELSELIDERLIASMKGSEHTATPRFSQ